MEFIECIFCKRYSDPVVITENGYTGRKCPICNLIYISPRPSLSKTLYLYTEEKAEIYARSNIGAGFAKRLAARHTISIIKKIRKSGSLLELGAGAGFFLNEAKKKRLEIYGIEPNKIQAKFMREKFNIVCEETPIEENSFRGKLFDIIYHCNVLSHFYDPVSEFKKINTKLKEGGIQVFETGNTGDVKNEYYKYFNRFDYPDHLFFFSEDSIRKLLEATGFELIKIYGYSKMGYLFTQNFLKQIKLIFKSLRVKKNLTASSTEKPSIGFRNKVSERRLFRNIKEYLLYLLAYKIGYFIPKKGHPQTLIVIAKKKPTKRAPIYR